MACQALLVTLMGSAQGWIDARDETLHSEM
jgi:hypothetical protein